MLRKIVENFKNLLNKKSEKRKLKGFILIEFLIFLGVLFGIIGVLYKVFYPKIQVYSAVHELFLIQDEKDNEEQLKNLNYFTKDKKLKNKYKHLLERIKKLAEEKGFADYDKIQSE